MDQLTTTFVAMDTHKQTISVAIAEGGRRGETRFLARSQSALKRSPRWWSGCRRSTRDWRSVMKPALAGYGLYRQIVALGHECFVVAPSLAPTRPGDRVKTDRRDAVTQAALFRSGELRPVWVPEEAHEAMRDLRRAREAAVETLRRARQQVTSFLLRQGRAVQFSILSGVLDGRRDVERGAVAGVLDVIGA